jgi:ubiquitin-protein ligase E3 C
LDPELHRNLLFLKRYTGKFEDLNLYFSVLAPVGAGKYNEVDLIPGGRDKPVTKDNLSQYIYHMAEYRLNIEIRQQCQAFFRGVYTIVPRVLVRMFGAVELQHLIGGDEVRIDVDDFEANVVYNGGYKRDHPTIQAFWRVVRRMSDENLHNLVKFITSCPRPPLLGFRYFNPLICIYAAGRDARLPSASTCMNLLKLPEYADEDTLEKCLILSITSGCGFDLS